MAAARGDADSEARAESIAEMKKYAADDGLNDDRVIRFRPEFDSE